MPRLVHLSDLHLQLDWDRRSLASTGWRGAPGRFELHALGRFARFERAGVRIARLLERVSADAPDHVLLTGDLTALGTREELIAVRTLLAPLIDAGRLTLVPGNHDRYTSSFGRRLFEEVFAPQLSTALPAYAVSHGYPFVHLIGQTLAVIGLDSTRVHAWSHYLLGRIGEPQLQALRRLLADPRLAGREVVVLSHHGPLGPDGAFDWRESGLLDSGRLLEVLEGQRVLFLHGHAHQRCWHPARGGRPHLIGGGSSTDEDSYGYWLIDLEPDQPVAARKVTPSAW